ncbi:MAG TPA: Nudix family hydrolase [Gammaproteobacteria bacterium]|nr:Nudix family hydrolase [Gammaproteobacteria bacterium]
MSTSLPTVHVLAAVIEDQAGRVLITRRPPHRPHGGLWEFPTGKRRSGESRLDALRRELHAELGIDVVDAHPLITVHHRCPGHRVMLDVWRLRQYQGTVRGREGRAVCWVAPARLSQYAFRAADIPVITAARLPGRYLITPEPEDEAVFLATLEARLAEGARLVQLRARRLNNQACARLAKEVANLCRDYQATWLANASPEQAIALHADGVHLSAARLRALDHRPLGRDRWVAASCHNAAELQHAGRIGVDFAVLSPVNSTRSHPGARPLGWEGFGALCDAARLPVFALGGMGTEDLAQAREHGAQGVAGISRFWNRPRAGGPQC